MRKILTLSKEQARTLYNLLSQHSISNRSDNRKRFKFLEVIEKFVFDFEDELGKLKGPRVELNNKATELGKGEEKFTFKDRDIFAAGKDIFEKSFATGTVNRNQMGKVERSPLVGRDAKVYVELEDRFADVKDIKEKVDRKKK